MADPQIHNASDDAAASRDARQAATRPTEQLARQGGEQTIGAERRSFQDGAETVNNWAVEAADAANRDVARTAADTTRQLGETGRRAGREVAQAWRSAMDPFAASQVEMTRWIDDLWRQMAGFSPLSSLHTARPFSGMGAASLFGLPATDIRETKDAYILAVELPGLTREDVDVALNGDVLTIRGHKAEEKAHGQAAYRISERRFGHFERGFPVPQGVDRQQLDATFRDGVLTIKLPKQEPSAQHEEKIQIKG